MSGMLGDVPIQSRLEDRLWIPSTNMIIKALLDNVSNASFFMVVGCPGIGKTTQICDAARDRGVAIYLDGAAQKSFKDIQATINQRYGSLYINFWSWLLSKPASGLKFLSRLSSWVRFFRRKRVVFIVDHIDKLAEADVLELVSWAKTKADHADMVVILVGSEQSTRLLPIVIPIPELCRSRKALSSSQKARKVALCSSQKARKTLCRSPKALCKSQRAL